MTSYWICCCGSFRFTLLLLFMSLLRTFDSKTEKVSRAPVGLRNDNAFCFSERGIGNLAELFVFLNTQGECVVGTK